jgi:hypothetical protein
MDLRPEVGGGQWGITFDNFGRKFFTSNSRHLVQLMYDARAHSWCDSAGTACRGYPRGWAPG